LLNYVYIKSDCVHFANGSEHCVELQAPCCQWHSYSVNIDITLGYPAANTSTTKDTLTLYRIIAM